MNVLSLPDEMLASVLKYKSFEDLTEIRKISSRIDSVARRYGLDKMKIDSLHVDYFEINVWVWLDDRLRTLPLSLGILDLLKYIFAKIRGVKHLNIDVSNKLYRRNNIISNEVGDFLLGKDCKNINKLGISNSQISINFNIMRNIVTKLKLKELYFNGTSFTAFEFSDALIEGIRFDSLILLNRKGIPMKLSLPYLARLWALKIPRKLVCKIKNSTVTDLEGYFKLWTKDMMGAVEWWAIMMSTGRMPVDETERDFSKLKCFEDCNVINWDGVRRDTIVYKIESKFKKNN